MLRDNLELNNGYNMDVQSMWYQLGLIAKKSDIIPFVDEFVSKTGRIKYLRPIFKAYVLYDLKLAKDVFEKNK